VFKAYTILKNDYLTNWVLRCFQPIGAYAMTYTVQTIVVLRCFQPMEWRPDQVSPAVFLAYRSPCNDDLTKSVLLCFQPIGAYAMTYTVQTIVVLRCFQPTGAYGMTSWPSESCGVSSLQEPMESRPDQVRPAVFPAYRSLCNCYL